MSSEQVSIISTGSTTEAPINPAYDRKFCKYTYVSGAKKGTICGRFCREYGEICGYHARQEKARMEKIRAKVDARQDQ